ncbi:MAG: hypothetical protein ACP6IS_09665 [Candidatus Asgardarchaeia archaeon]
MSIIIKVDEKGRKELEKIFGKTIDIKVGDYLMITYSGKGFEIRKIDASNGVISLVKLTKKTEKEK